MSETVELDQAQTQKLLRLLAKANLSDRPILLSIKGCEDLVVMKTSYYQEMLDELEEADIAAINEGCEDMKAGRGRPWREVMEELRKEFGLSEPQFKNI